MMQRTTKKRGFFGAVLTVLGALTVLAIGIAAAAQIPEAGMPLLTLWAGLWILTALAVGVSLIYCLMKRRREILSGEEEEARKY